MIINPFIWYGARELELIPKHFTRCTTPINVTSKYWIRNNAKGRYSFSTTPNLSDMLSFFEYAYFEKTSDAVLYELMWSGT